MLGTNLRSFLTKWITPRLYEEVIAGLERGGNWVGDVWGHPREGCEYVVSMSVRRINQPDGSAQQYVIVAKDVTDAARARFAMVQQNHLMENALDSIDGGSWKWNIKTGELVVNVRWLSMIGYSCDELEPLNIERFINLLHPDDRPAIKQGFDVCLSSMDGRLRAEVRISHKQGEWVWVLIQGKVMEYGANGDPEIVFGVNIDISEKINHLDNLEYVSLHDVITGLPNRTLLSEELGHEMDNARRLKTNLAVAYVDIDDFSALNQKYGRDIGDKVLLVFSQMLRESKRGGDLLSRVGGDEFVIVFLDLDSEAETTACVENLCDKMKNPIIIDGCEIAVTFSAGVSNYPQGDSIDAEQLVRQSDQAMYHAKQLGKQRYHIFDAEGDLYIRDRHRNIEHIREAFHNKEFVLFYQPKVDMRTGELVGLEALIRWDSSSRGLILPNEFIPIIERNSLAIEVGYWVINEALMQLDCWNSQGVRHRVSVNITSEQLQNGKFFERLKQLFLMYPAVEYEQLELEILESAALEDMGHVAELIDSCSRIGVNFSLDDFGTGYSSLSYLKQLAADTVKIDQSFIRHMFDGGEHVAIVHSIVELSRTFNRRSVAEGVESEAHGNLLLQLGCVYGQGYCIGRPMPAEELPYWIKTWRPYSSWKSSKRVPYEHIPALFAEIEYLAWFGVLNTTINECMSPSSELFFRYKRLQRWLKNPSNIDVYSSNSLFKNLAKDVALLHDSTSKFFSRPQTTDLAGRTLFLTSIQTLHEEVLSIFSALRM